MWEVGRGVGTQKERSGLEEWPEGSEAKPTSAREPARGPLSVERLRVSYSRPLSVVCI